MKSLVSHTLVFLIAFLLPLTQSSVEAQDDLVTKTCQKSPSYKLCVSTLRSDPRSKTADVAGLGLIVVDAVKAKTTSTLNQVNKLMTTSNSQLKGPLSKCAEFYNAVLKADIPSAIEALTKGVPKFAESGMVDAANEADFCEKGFIQSKSPLTDMNKAVHDLSLVATAIIRLLL